MFISNDHNQKLTLLHIGDLYEGEVNENLKYFYLIIY